MDITSAEYDGFHMLPSDNSNDDETVQFHFFAVKPDKLQGDTIGKTQIGDVYNVVLFQANEDGDVQIDKSFEAIFADPVEYAKGLVGMKIYGTFVKKTQEAQIWFDDFLQETINRAEKINSNDGKI